jgi:hypothetical protein
MGVFEVQGIVAFESGMPMVQFRQLDEEGELALGFQIPPLEARELAQNINEAATNAIYEAALLSWAKERDPASGEAMAAMMIGAVRQHRMDKWGLPSKPEDWNNSGDPDA